jgi:hypothetical protein
VKASLVSTLLQGAVITGSLAASIYAVMQPLLAK